MFGVYTTRFYRPTYVPVWMPNLVNHRHIFAYTPLAIDAVGPTYHGGCSPRIRLKPQARRTVISPANPGLLIYALL